MTASSQAVSDDSSTAKTPSKQALAGTRINAFMMDPNHLTIVGLDTKDGPEHPLYDKRAFEPIDEAMVINVMAVGILEPILVRKNGDLVEVVAGRHRVLWAREANKRLAVLGMALHMVPTMSPRKDTDAGFMGIMVSENEGRKEDSFVGRAEKALKLSKLGMTVKDIAIRFVVTEAAVNSWLAYWDLAPEVQAQVASGALAASSAVHLAPLPRAEQVVALQEAVTQSGGQPSSTGKVVSGKAIKAAVKTATKKKAASKSPARAAADPDTSGGQAVGKKLLAAIVVTGADTLDPAFIKGLQFAMGDLEPGRVAGLLKVIRAINNTREEKGLGVLYAGDGG